MEFRNLLKKSMRFGQNAKPSLTAETVAIPSNHSPGLAADRNSELNLIVTPGILASL